MFIERECLLQSNLTHLPRHEFVPGVGMGIAKCPYDPADNSTAVWVEKGNPGDLPALYSGTNAEFTKADTVIFRTDLYNLTTGRKAFSFKRTLKYDSKWLDSKCPSARQSLPLFFFLFIVVLFVIPFSYCLVRATRQYPRKISAPACPPGTFIPTDRA